MEGTRTEELRAQNSRDIFGGPGFADDDFDTMQFETDGMPEEEETNRPEFFFRAAAAWDAMYLDCLKAEKSISVEQYIFTNDASGKRFLELFIEKAARGVEVRMVLDALGSRTLAKDPLIAKLRAVGGEVEFYHQIAWHGIFYPLRWLPRTHVKTLLIDNKIAYTGSACIRDYMRNWHELVARFTGEAAEDAHAEQDRFWQTLTQKKGAPPEQPPGKDDLEHFVSEPHFGTSYIYREMIARIDAAETHIRVATPYFAPPRRLRKALERASMRGVKVEVLLSAATDVKLADCVSRIYIPRLLQKGVRLYLHTDDVLHAKYVLVDGWAAAGSVNLDYLSLTRNREASVIFKGAAELQRLWEYSNGYIRRAHRVDLAYWRNLPYIYKLAGRIGWYAREIL